MTDFLVYDVFTQNAFGGNPLAVIPNATALPEADLQAIAREFNFSETTFVYPGRDPSRPRVRIFTPTNEVPFAGHPTIGTAIALSDLTGLTNFIFELKVGPIPCIIHPGTPALAEFTTEIPLEILAQVPVQTIADCAGLAASQIKTTLHDPEIASVGLPFALVELIDSAALEQASPNMDAFRRAEASFGNEIDMFATYLYVRNGTKISARMFAPLNNIPEDPATGSAAAALGNYLSQLEQSALELTIQQGVTMGRPSDIKVTTSFAAGKIRAVTIGGSAVRTMQGKLVY